jgi:hypothetical protein
MRLLEKKAISILGMLRRRSRLSQGERAEALSLWCGWAGRRDGQKEASLRQGIAGALHARARRPGSAGPRGARARAREAPRELCGEFGDEVVVDGELREIVNLVKRPRKRCQGVVVTAQRVQLFHLADFVRELPDAVLVHRKLRK